MKIHEENLNKILKFIEEFGIIDKVEIKNSSTKIIYPNIKDKISKVKELDFNRAKEFIITFTMGDVKLK